MKKLFCASLVVFLVSLNSGDATGQQEIKTIENQTLGQIYVCVPNGGERWKVGSKHNIEWVQSFLGGNVEIQYYTGSGWSMVTSSTSDDGSYRWTVPNTPTEYAKVMIIKTDDRTNYDMSDGNFEIYEEIGEPDLVISSGTPTVTPSTVAPGGGVSLSAWTVKNQGNVASGSFSNGFYLSTDATITSSDTYLTGNSNSSLDPAEQFNWGGGYLTIPAGTTPGNYYIGILVDRNNQVSESKENNNYVSTPLTVSGVGSITVTDPSGGHYIAGQNMYIGWTSSGVSGNVKIELYKGSSSYKVITSSTSNDGSYSWNISGVSAGTDYKIKVSSVSVSSVYDYGSNFKICTQIYVTVPNGGENWMVGQNKNIEWATSGLGGNVKIRYSTNGGSSWSDVTSSTSDDGSYSWTIPNTPTTQAKVEIIHTTYTNNKDQSDGNFTILTVSTEEKSVLPEVYKVSQPCPTPAKGKVTISYQLPEPAQVSLKIYDITGKLVKVLKQSYEPAGTHQIIWNTEDNSSNRVSRGIYFIRFEVPINRDFAGSTGEFKTTRKLTILR